MAKRIYVITLPNGESWKVFDSLDSIHKFLTEQGITAEVNEWDWRG